MIISVKVKRPFVACQGCEISRPDLDTCRIDTEDTYTAPCGARGWGWLEMPDRAVCEKSIEIGD